MQQPVQEQAIAKQQPVTTAQESRANSYKWLFFIYTGQV